MYKKYRYGNRLREIRGDKTMEELCEIFHKYVIDENKKKNPTINENEIPRINKSMISRWENGNTMPDSKQIALYAKCFNVDANYLFGLTDIKSSLDSKLNQIEESNKNKLEVELLELLKTLDTSILNDIKLLLNVLISSNKISKLKDIIELLK